MVSFMVDYTTIITGAAMVGGIIFGAFQIKAYLERRTEQTEHKIQSWIGDSDKRIIENITKNIEVVDSKFKVVDSRISKDEEDIEDVEDDMKVMTQQFREICDRLSKHDYMMQIALPEFKDLKKEFYKFKTAVDTNYKVGFTQVGRSGEVQPHHTNDNIDDSEKER